MLCLVMKELQRKLKNITPAYDIFPLCNKFDIKNFKTIKYPIKIK